MSFDPIVYDAVSQVIGKFSKFDPRIRISYPIFSSRTWTAPFDGLAIVRVMGAGGSGGQNSVTIPTATGGYSGAWGCKIVRVTAGQELTFIIGAGGTPRAFSPALGIGGGNSSVTINGVMYVAAGGAGGSFNQTTVPDAPALPNTWDFGAASVKPGIFPGGVTGGAGVDILMQGNNATTSASLNGSGGGGTGGPSFSLAGGAMTPTGTNALGTADGGTGYDASRGEWGISFIGGSGGRPGGGGGGNGGGGGGASGNGGNGGNGGGGGSSAVIPDISGAGIGLGNGGLGGGGGSNGGSGGDGYAHIEFFPDTPV